MDFFLNSFSYMLHCDYMVSCRVIVNKKMANERPGLNFF